MYIHMCCMQHCIACSIEQTLYGTEHLLLLCKMTVQVQWFRTLMSCACGTSVSEINYCFYNITSKTPAIERVSYQAMTVLCSFPGFSFWPQSRICVKIFVNPDLLTILLGTILVISSKQPATSQGSANYLSRMWELPHRIHLWSVLPRTLSLTVAKPEPATFNDTARGPAVRKYRIICPHLPNGWRYCCGGSLPIFFLHCTPSGCFGCGVEWGAAGAGLVNPVSM